MVPSWSSTTPDILRFHNFGADETPETKSRKFPDRKQVEHFAALDYHGVADILEAKSKSLSIFWVVVTCLATVAATWMSHLTANALYETPVVSKILYIQSRNLSYPTVTICDSFHTYFLNKTKLQMDNVSDESVLLMLLSVPVWYTQPSKVPSPAQLLSNSVALEFRNKMEHVYGGSVGAIREFYRKYSVDCNALFASCRTANFAKVPCCSEQLFRPVMTLYNGLCFASKFEESYRIAGAGVLSNFYVRLRKLDDLWSPGAVEKHNGQFGLTMTIDTGINQGFWRSRNVNLRAGNWKTIRLSLTQIHRRVKPCIKTSDLQYFADYTNSNCLWEKLILRHPLFVLPDNCVLPALILTRQGVNFLSNQSADGTKNWKTDFGQRRLCSAEDNRNFLFNFSDSDSAEKRSGAGGNYAVAYWKQRLPIPDKDQCPTLCDRYDISYSERNEPETSDNVGFTFTLVDNGHRIIWEVPALMWWEIAALIGACWIVTVGGSVISVFQFLIYICQLVSQFCFNVRQKENLNFPEAKLSKTDSVTTNVFGLHEFIDSELQKTSL